MAIKGKKRKTVKVIRINSEAFIMFRHFKIDELFFVCSLRTIDFLQQLLWKEKSTIRLIFEGASFILNRRWNWPQITQIEELTITIRLTKHVHQDGSLKNSTAIFGQVSKDKQSARVAQSSAKSKHYEIFEILTWKPVESRKRVSQKAVFIYSMLARLRFRGTYRMLMPRKTWNINIFFFVAFKLSLSLVERREKAKRASSKKKASFLAQFALTLERDNIVRCAYFFLLTAHETLFTLCSKNSNWQN